VGIRHHQLHPIESSGLQLAEELGPESLVFGVSTSKPRASQRLQPQQPLGTPPGGSRAICGISRRGIQTGKPALPDPGLGTVGTPRAGPRRSATPPTWRPRIKAKPLHEVVDLPGRDAVQIRLIHHREQRLIDPAAALQQGREEFSLPQLGDRQIQISHGRCQRSQARPVSVGAPLRGALERSSADECGRSRVDQLLIKLLGRQPDPVGHMGGFQPSKQFERADCGLPRKGTTVSERTS